MRLWETGGRGDGVPLQTPGFNAAFKTDLLEREQGASSCGEARSAFRRGAWV